MKYCNYHSSTDNQYAYQCDDCMLGDVIEPEQVGTVGEWYINEQGAYYKVACSEDIEANLKELLALEVPF